MISCRFLMAGGQPLGFLLEGHHGQTGGGQYDMLCAAVSSAAYLTANTVTDICGCAADTDTADGLMTLRVAKADATRCRDILLGLRLHLRSLAEDYPDDITVIDQTVL